MTGIPATIGECDIVEMAPSAIKSRVNPQMLDQWETITYRGHSVDLDHLALHLAKSADGSWVGGKVFRKALRDGS